MLVWKLEITTESRKKSCFFKKTKPCKTCKPVHKGKYLSVRDRHLFLLGNVPLHIASYFSDYTWVLSRERYRSEFKTQLTICLMVRARCSVL